MLARLGILMRSRVIPISAAVRLLTETSVILVTETGVRLQVE